MNSIKDCRSNQILSSNIAIFTSRAAALSSNGLSSHWIDQNSILMSWPETTEHTNVLHMTQGFRDDLSFLSRPQNFFLPLWISWYSLQMTISLKWKKILGSGQKRKVISGVTSHIRKSQVSRDVFPGIMGDIFFRSWAAPMWMQQNTQSSISNYSKELVCRVPTVPSHFNGR